MKLLLLNAALTFLALPAVCQDLTVTYNITGKEADPDNPVVKSLLLINKDSVSKFVAVLPEKYAAQKTTSEGIVKDKVNKICYCENSFFKVKFNIKDSLCCMKWQPADKIQTILGYPCLSATTTFRGRKYLAYYTSKLPVADGPWKLGGLPGLILAAKTDDGYIEWQATNVVQGKAAPINMEVVRGRKNLAWNDFVVEYKEAVKRYTKYVRSRGNYDESTTFQLLVESIEVFYPELQTGKGLTY